MNKNRVICLIWCTLMLALCIWLSGCEKTNDDAHAGKSEPEYYITIHEPNSNDILAEGYGTFWQFGKYTDLVKMVIDDKCYMTQWSNVVVEWAVK